MEVMVAVQSGTLLRDIRVHLKRRVSARRGGGFWGVLTRLDQTDLASVYSHWD